MSVCRQCGDSSGRCTHAFNPRGVPTFKAVAWDGTEATRWLCPHCGREIPDAVFRVHEERRCDSGVEVDAA